MVPRKASSAPAGNCSTYHCYKGGPEEPPAGLATAGCPVYSHPAQLTDNRNCVLCMTCDKARPLSVWSGMAPTSLGGIAGTSKSSA